MARTVYDIKKTMTDSFMLNSELSQIYGFELKSDFNKQFSVVSFENIVFYLVAVAMWVSEKLFDEHKTELTNLIDTKKPHRLKWYRDKTLAFQFGYSLTEDLPYPLVEDADYYAEIVESAKIIKYASVSEYQGRIYIKVAKGETTKEPLSINEQIAVEYYLSEIKDAGVRIGDTDGKVSVINSAADHFQLKMDIYYNPMVYDKNGTNLKTGEQTIKNTIKDFLENKIPFNGEYRNANLVDTLQTLDGVEIPELKLAKTISDAEFNTGNWKEIEAKHLPVSGYYKIYDDADLQLNYIAYQTIESV